MEPLPTQPLESQLSTLPRAPLMPFDATGRMAAAIPFAFEDYLELVDTTGRVIREEQRGYIPGETPKILERLNIGPEQFIATTARMLQQFSTAIGTPHRTLRDAQHRLPARHDRRPGVVRAQGGLNR